MNNDFLSFLLLILGGMSTAIWGIIISFKSGKCKGIKSLLLEFFHFKASIRSYLFILIMLCIVFGESIIQGKLVDGGKWYLFGVCFLTAILFGGIEEIGWRYTFQPNMEAVLPFSDIPRGLSAELFEEWVCGCDNCQDACPYNRRHDWNEGEEFSNLKEIASAILPENYENLSDEFLIEQVISKTAGHLQAADIHALRKNARRAFHYQKDL